MTGIIYERIMKQDCQQYGWILVDYPKCSMNLKALTNFMIPPNK